MKEHIGLREALSILGDTLDPSLLIQDKRLQDFVNAIDTSGVDILSPLDDDYLQGAVSFLKATAFSALITTSDGDMQTMMLAMTLAQSDIFDKLVTILFKHAVGLAAIEELR